MSTLKAGGGQTVGLNFINALREFNFAENKLVFLTAKNSMINKTLEVNENNIQIKTFSNPILRILSELLISRFYLKKHKIEVIYSCFGFGFFPKKIIQIIGSADSNLYFPEINFWEGYKGVSLWKKKIIDQYRIFGLKRSTAIVFENQIMEKRFHELFDKTKKTCFIKPSIKIIDEKFKLEILNNINTNSMKGLFLCGWQLNKKVLDIPELLFELKNQNIKIEIILTANPDGSDMHKTLIEKLIKYDVRDLVHIIGPVDHKYLYDLYQKIDFVFLLSKLESFSNNIIEAWYFKKVLIIADEIWSRSICSEAALFVDRSSPKKIAIAIKNYLQDQNMKVEIQKKSNIELNKYPDIRERLQMEFNFIKEVYESH